MLLSVAQARCFEGGDRTQNMKSVMQVTSSTGNATDIVN